MVFFQNLPTPLPPPPQKSNGPPLGIRLSVLRDVNVSLCFWTKGLEQENERSTERKFKWDYA